MELTPHPTESNVKPEQAPDLRDEPRGLDRPLRSPVSQSAGSIFDRKTLHYHEGKQREKGRKQTQACYTRLHEILRCQRPKTRSRKKSEAVDCERETAIVIASPGGNEPD